MPSIFKVIIFSLGSIAFLFIISKILGKKQIAQLDFVDYVFGISLGSIAANMATDTGGTPFYYYLTALTVFFAFSLLVVFLERKGPVLKNFFKGKPKTVIYEGKIDYKQLKKSKIDINDLIALSRDKGYFDLNDIAYAILENSGSLSVMPKSPQKPVTVEDLNLPIAPAKFPFYLIDDGHISYSSLTELNKDISWLYKKAGIKNKKDLKNIILASYDKENKTIIVSRKDD
ncbi:MAG: DUF421 domain-containing protein [Firmicutes bacterium]|nr:DUF421 domain-containing protein [Bacillota bacterium]